MKVAIVCETPGCKNEGKAFNVITDLSEEGAEMLLEAFGHGSEDDADYCPKCGELGIAQDPEEE